MYSYVLLHNTYNTCTDTRDRSCTFDVYCNRLSLVQVYSRIIREKILYKVVKKATDSAPSKYARNKQDRAYCIGVVKRTLKVRASS